MMKIEREVLGKEFIKNKKRQHEEQKIKWPAKCECTDQIVKNKSEV